MDRNFGLELEIARPRIESTKTILQNGGTQVIANHDSGVPKRDKRRYTKGAEGKWRVTREGDCPSGCELVSPIFNDSNPDCFDAIYKVCSTLNESRSAEIDAMCGLHVHVEAKDFNAVNLANLMRITQNFDGDLNSYTMRNRRMGPESLQENLTALSNSRLSGNDLVHNYVNTTYGSSTLRRSGSWHPLPPTPRGVLGLASWVRQGTVEFRHCKATFDFDKMRTWINLTINLVEWASNHDQAFPDLPNQVQDFAEASV